MLIASQRFYNTKESFFVASDSCSHSEEQGLLIQPGTLVQFLGPVTVVGQKEPHSLVLFDGMAVAMPSCNLIPPTENRYYLFVSQVRKKDGLKPVEGHYWVRELTTKPDQATALAEHIELPEPLEASLEFPVLLQFKKSLLVTGERFSTAQKYIDAGEEYSVLT